MIGVRTGIWTSDPLMGVGLISYFRSHSEICVLPEERLTRAQVFLVVTDHVNTQTMKVLRTNATVSDSPTVLVTGRVNPHQLLTVLDHGVITILPRQEATGTMVIDSIKNAVDGRGALPEELQSELVQQVGRLQRDVLAPLGINNHGLSEREMQVLRLLADGLDTSEIAVRLSYSERTVKGAIGSVLNRFQVRNRVHAIAYALRAGVI